MCNKVTMTYREQRRRGMYGSKRGENGLTKTVECIRANGDSSAVSRCMSDD
jgi:hypothetical protein